MPSKPRSASTRRRCPRAPRGANLTAADARARTQLQSDISAQAQTTQTVPLPRERWATFGFQSVVRRQHVRTFVVICFAILSTGALLSQAPQRATPVEPVSAIIRAFKTHQIVALGEGAHRNEQGHRFRLSLIRDARFATTVQDLVVEWGNARYQDVMDRFTRGEDISYGTLRRVWQDTTSADGMWDVPMYEEFFRMVRTVNRSLPAERKMRVLLGDPPVDWDAIYTSLDLKDWDRDGHAASVIRAQVIAKGRRGLVIYGDGHLQRNQRRRSLVSQLEDGGVKVFTITTPTADLTDLQSNIVSWRSPSLAMLRGTVFSQPTIGLSAGRFDALLYLGPASTITFASLPGSLCKDRAYMQMRLRRLSLLPAPPGPWNPAERLKAYCARVSK